MRLHLPTMLPSPQQMPQIPDVAPQRLFRLRSWPSRTPAKTKHGVCANLRALEPRLNRNLHSISTMVHGSHYPRQEGKRVPPHEGLPGLPTGTRSSHHTVPTWPKRNDQSPTVAISMYHDSLRTRKMTTGTSLWPRQPVESSYLEIVKTTTDVARQETSATTALFVARTAAPVQTVAGTARRGFYVNDGLWKLHKTQHGLADVSRGVGQEPATTSAGRQTDGCKINGSGATCSAAKSDGLGCRTDW